MPRTRDRRRLRIVDLHKAGKGYKSISKKLDVHQSTVRQIVYKWRKFSTLATLPRSGHPAKMTARAQCRMLNEVKRNPRVSAIDLQTSQEHANISVDESTIRKTLNNSWEDTMEEATAVQKKSIAERLKFAKVHLDIPQRYWRNILWTDETSVELFGRNTTLCGEKKRHSTPTSNTSS